MASNGTIMLVSLIVIFFIFLTLVFRLTRNGNRSRPDSGIYNVPPQPPHHHNSTGAGHHHGTAGGHHGGGFHSGGGHH